MKRKILSLFVITAMVMATAACGDSSGSSTTPTPSAGQQSTETAGDTPTEDNSSGDSGNDSTPGEKVTVTYANWNLGTVEENNVERQMLQRFNETSTSAEVVIAENVDYSDYAASLSTLAASGGLPDIIMLQNIPQPYTNKWLKDITSVASADSDWNTLIPALTDSVYVNGKIVAVPFAMHLMGGLINLDLFEATNTTPLEYGYTLEEFETALKSLTQPARGIVGLKSEGGMVNWLPAISNARLGFFTFDGNQYNLDSDDFQNAIRKSSSYRKDGLTFTGLSESQLANFTATNDWEAWANGEAAISFDGTWGFSGLGDTFKFDMAFIGLPNSRSVLIPDYFAMTPGCQYPEQAFELMKWMSYGGEGFSNRISIASESGSKYISMPMTTSQQLMDEYFAFLTVPGLREAFEGLGSSFVELVKVTPGYVASRWEAETGLAIGEQENATIGQVIDMAVRDEINFSDYATQINDLANKNHQDVLSQMN